MHHCHPLVTSLPGQICEEMRTDGTEHQYPGGQCARCKTHMCSFPITTTITPSPLPPLCFFLQHCTLGAVVCQPSTVTVAMAVVASITNEGFQQPQ